MLTAAVFGGYYASAILGPSGTGTFLVLTGLVGLVLASLFSGHGHADSCRPAWMPVPAFFLTTTITYFFAKYVSLLFHEWSHAIWANSLGVRTGSIFDIHYGSGWIMKGIWSVDGGGFYTQLFDSGQGVTAALVACGGPLTNLLLALLSMLLLHRMKTETRPLVAYALFWMALHNLAQLWSYIPVRTIFYDGGDIHYLCKGLNIPPWLFSAVGTVVLSLASYFLFAKLMPKVFKPLHLSDQGRNGLFALAWTTVFLYYGAMPIVFHLSSITDPSIFPLAIELSIGVGLASLVTAQLRNTESD